MCLCLIFPRHGVCYNGFEFLRRTLLLQSSSSSSSAKLVDLMGYSIAFFDGSGSQPLFALILLVLDRFANTVVPLKTADISIFRRCKKHRICPSNVQQPR